MAPEALAPNDQRVEHKFLRIDEDITYHYLLAKPETEPAAMVLLLHG